MFLHSRKMSHMISFWMDAEKFSLIKDPKEMKKCFTALEILYLKVGIISLGALSQFRFVAYV